MTEESEFYSKSRKTHPDLFGVYHLTERERINLGLQQPAPLKGLIHIMVPIHRDASSMQWESRFVTRGSLPAWLRQYPNLEIVSRGGNDGKKK